MMAKKIISLSIIFGLVLLITSSCSIPRPLDIPFGKWENTEMGLVLDISPDICVPNPEWLGQDMCRFPGTYVLDGELINVQISFHDTQTFPGFSIHRYPIIIGQPIDVLYSGWEHRVEQNRLYLGRGEQTIVLERVLEYEVG